MPLALDFGSLDGHIQLSASRKAAAGGFSGTIQCAAVGSLASSYHAWINAFGFVAGDESHVRSGALLHSR